MIQIDDYHYPSSLSKEHLLELLLMPEEYQIRKYLKFLRKEEAHIIADNPIRRYWWRGRRNRLGAKLGFVIHPGNFGPGLKIWHYGSIIVNPKARIGKNCQLHGNCCIGNRGGDSQSSPVIGDNVNIGQGAQILGDIIIADNVTIGAGSIVLKSIMTPGVTVVGVPAHVVDCSFHTEVERKTPVEKSV